MSSGGGGGGVPADTTNVQTIREAPEIEARRLGLMDAATELAKKPTSLPAYQVAGMAPAGLCVFAIRIERVFAVSVPGLTAWSVTIQMSPLPVDVLGGEDSGDRNTMISLSAARCAVAAA